MPKRLLTVPHHKQQRESDCLTACAAMALDTLDVYVPYQQLLEILDVASWGTPHRSIKHLADHFTNIVVTYKQGALPDLFQEIDSGHPVIVFVWTGDLPYWTVETWHAVVIIGYDNQHFYINDPAVSDAPQIVSHGDLDLAWIAYDSYWAMLTKM